VIWAADERGIRPDVFTTGAAQGGWAVTGPRLEGTDRKGTAMLETEHSVTLLTIMEIAAPIILAGSLI
jgi:hypothetical protein